jgi:hypothetical protein
MPDCLCDTHFAGGKRAAKIEVVDHAVRGGDQVCNLLGLGSDLGFLRNAKLPKTASTVNKQIPSVQMIA